MADSAHITRRILLKAATLPAATLPAAAIPACAPVPATASFTPLVESSKHDAELVALGEAFDQAVREW